MPQGGRRAKKACMETNRNQDASTQKCPCSSCIMTQVGPLSAPHVCLKHTNTHTFLDAACSPQVSFPFKLQIRLNNKLIRLPKMEKMYIESSDNCPSLISMLSKRSPGELPPTSLYPEIMAPSTKSASLPGFPCPCCQGNHTHSISCMSSSSSLPHPFSSKSHLGLGSSRSRLEDKDLSASSLSGR